MHDDRFQETRGRGRGRQRRMVNNRKLWNPKEEQAWVHDRFDEMNLHDFHGDNGKRKQGGCFRGRGGGPGGRPRGISRGNFRGNRSRAYYHDGSNNYSYVPKESHVYRDNSKNARRASYDDGKNRVSKLSHAHYDDVSKYDIVPKESRTYYSDPRSQKNAPRVVRESGAKRYQPRWRSTTEISSLQNNKSQNEDMSSNANLGKHQPQTSNSRSEQVLQVKQTVASTLNSASPPFYPSRSSHQELPVSQVGNGQPSSNSRPFSSSIGMAHVSPTPQYGNLLRGKPFVPSVGHVEASMKGMNSPALQSSASSPKGSFPVAANQATRDYVRPTHPIVQPSPVQSSTQSVPGMPGLMFGARFGGSNKMPSYVQPVSTILSEDTEISSHSGSNNPNTRLKVKGQSADQGEERASFLYGGAHILGATGAMGLTLGDQGFHGTPALLPVMQLGGQRPGGPGAPSIAMALPGFVSQQQQLGLSNSEMTWLPMLTGASGALGAPYGSPYIAVDGSYYSRPSEQASSPVSFREPSGSNASSSLKSQEMTEVVSDELSQRQNKPRRYSEMNFGQ
uniref:Btz domain-containing protein n=1 Tax=Arundo donax TaxID=35708 RepID=A0A0A9AUG5_ARUDO